MINFTPRRNNNANSSERALPYLTAEDAMICCYVFEDEKARTLSSLDEALGWLSNHPPEEYTEQSFLWLHLNLSNAHIHSWLQSHLDLPETFYENLQEEGDPTRIEREEDMLIATINDVLFDFDFDADDMATLHMAILPHLVVTARKKPLRCTDRLRTDIKNGFVPDSPMFMLSHLLDDQADELDGIVQEITKKANSIEDKILANHIKGGNNRALLGNLRRLIVRLQRLLAPEPNAMFRLISNPPEWIDENDIQNLSESTEEFASVIQEMTSLNERIKIMQEEITAIINEGNNRSLYLLTIVTVLALPFNIVAGLFGMNVGGIPLEHGAHGFALIVLALTLFVVIILIWLWRTDHHD